MIKAYVTYYHPRSLVRLSLNYKSWFKSFCRSFRLFYCEINRQPSMFASSVAFSRSIKLKATLCTSSCKSSLITKFVLFELYRRPDCSTVSVGNCFLFGWGYIVLVYCPYILLWFDLFVLSAIGSTHFTLDCLDFLSSFAEIILWSTFLTYHAPSQHLVSSMITPSLSAGLIIQ